MISSTSVFARSTASVLKLGVIHILRNHQGGGVQNDYANVIFAISNV